MGPLAQRSRFPKTLRGKAEITSPASAEAPARQATDRTDNTDGWMRPELGLNQSSALDFNGRTIWIADAHRDHGKRFIVRADEKLTAFLELESMIRAAERPEDCGAREITLDNCRGSSKSPSISSSDSFTFLRHG
jgi:hypothetical protein